MINHIVHILEPPDNLKAIGEDINDLYLSAILLSSLLSSYGINITALEVKCEKERNSEFIKEKLTSVFYRRTENSGSSCAASAVHIRLTKNKIALNANKIKFALIAIKNPDAGT